MPRVTQLFDQPTLLTYTMGRTWDAFLGDSLFPSTKVDTLDIEYLRGKSKIPTLANIAAFDTEARIGSRSGEKAKARLGYVKRKMFISEEDLIAMNNPRTPTELEYIRNHVYDDIDQLVMGVRGRIEKMRMDLLATGKVSGAIDGFPEVVVDYHVPKEHQVTPTTPWTEEGSDPIADMQTWVSELDFAPTRALTSRKVQNALLQNKSILAMFKDLGQLASVANLNALLISFGLPTLLPYDAKYYAENEETGKKVKERFLPEDSFVMFGDGTLGETVYGPSPEENRFLMAGGNGQLTMQNNVFVMIYEESQDPITTWEKASASALPSLVDADNIIQASGLLPKA